MNPANRKRYDQDLFPGGVPAVENQNIDVTIAPAAPRHAVDRGPLPAAPLVDEQTVWTGDLLRQFRHARGLELRDISERTKVGLHYLEALEDEYFEKLPAPVYLRGFLTEYTRTVKIEGLGAVEGYMERFRGNQPVEQPRT